MADSIFNVLFPLAMMLFCLKVRLPLTYRIISALQGISLIVFSQHLYLRFEDFYLLKILYKSNGYYSQPDRVSTQPLHFITPVLVLLVGFAFGLIGLYFPTRIHTHNYESYTAYLK